jgi:hypothetical protein
MTRQAKAAVRQVLREAAERIPHFWDSSDAERLCAMIALGYELGKSAKPAPVRQKLRRWR